MRHVIVKLWPRKNEAQKRRLAEAVTRDVTAILSSGDESVSVAIEEVDAERWRDDVYIPDIINQPGKLYKKPGYKMCR
jgi:4-oxalocrotonate tautomerase